MFIPEHGAVLAPMRALTQPPFWRILNQYGPPDAYFSEFVRVHENYVIEPPWIEEALQAAGSVPLWIQLMGNSLKALTASIRVLKRYPIVGLDFNVGCPVPKIYKKQTGGGLLKDLSLLKTLLAGLRELWTKPLCVKFRIGFNSTEDFDKILDLLIESHIDLATLHARTVSDLYKGQPRYEYVTQAAHRCPFPVLANGSIESVESIERVIQQTHCWGVMLGRSAFRNPWIFSQWKSFKANQTFTLPTLMDVYQYLQDLFLAFQLDKKTEITALGCMKRFTNFVGLSIDASGTFLEKMRTAPTLKTFWSVCKRHLLQQPNTPYSDKPFPQLHAYPNKELQG